MVDKGDLGTGTSGRYHGLLHSGARYVVRDPIAARECIVENRVLRRIAPATIEDTGGYFVATPDDPEDYVEGFTAACAAAGVECEDVNVAELLRREPALSPRIRRAFAVPDASLEPWQLIEANINDARRLGSSAWPYQRVVAMSRGGRRIFRVTLRDERSGSLTEIAPRFVVSAAGAWAGRVASLAGVELEMSPGKGTMLVYNQRMTDTVINRCHPPGDGDIMVPVHLVAILGTTEERVEDPDRYEIGRDEVEALIVEGEKLFPGLRQMRILRAYAGVRPLYQAPSVVQVDGEASPTDGKGDVRAVSRAHAVIDHAASGVENYVSIVGGKLTTYRLMAEQTADLVCRKLGVTERCSTADEVLPGQGDGRSYWLGHRLAEHEERGGGDAALICECELVTREGLERYLDEHWPCSLDDVRRGTRLGMGPCQGGFCTFRAGAVLAMRHDADTSADAAGPADAAIVAFLRERFKGIRPICWGRQLQELWLVNGMYQGTLAFDAGDAGGAPPGPGRAVGAASPPQPAAGDAFG